MNRIEKRLHVERILKDHCLEVSEMGTGVYYALLPLDNSYLVLGSIGSIDNFSVYKKTEVVGGKVCMSIELHV